MKKRHAMTTITVFFLSLICGDILSRTPIREKTTNVLFLLIAFAAGVITYLLFFYLFRVYSDRIKNCNFTQAVLSLLCFIICCVCGGLISIPLSKLPGYFGRYIPILTVIFIYIAMGILLSYRKDAFIEFINRATNGKIQLSEVAAEHETKALLDTSVIIDGRIADIAECGFIPGTLLVPNFILQELQFIADSEDSQRRQRGRRGLETLSVMQKSKTIAVKITDFDIPNVREVDAKLMQAAIELNCPILTNDYNLNKVAELQGIKILNVNDLANAVKSILLPGETLIVNVIQEGKEPNQGVGYMEDGTMVVVENGRPFLSQQIDVTVTKILQTAAGRMIFARHEKELGVKR